MISNYAAAKRVARTNVHREWAKEREQCSSRIAALERVAWTPLPDDHFINDDDPQKNDEFYRRARK